jgi:putative transposase
MAQAAVTAQRTTIRHACATVAVSDACYRDCATRRSENEVIADWLIRLTTTYRT